MNQPLVKLSHVCHNYLLKKRAFPAVKDVSFEIYPEETLGLVGESGCGKTTIARLLMNMIKPSSGEIYYRGQNLLTLPKKARNLLMREIQMVFQDPYSSMNPRMTVGEIIKEPLVIYQMGTKNSHEMRVHELLELVGLDSNYEKRYPHELSGGQRQRVVIARALSPNPKFLICDEPTSSLDVSIQAQIINLLKSLQKELGLTYLFISHDLSLIKYLSDRVAVMYMGEIIETATSDELYKNPIHPYTKALLSAIPAIRQVENSAIVPTPVLQLSRYYIVGLQEK